MKRKENYLNRLWNWRRKAAGGLPSTEMNWENCGTFGQTRPPVTPSSNTYHQSCQTLLLSHFWEIMLTGNLRWLIISGQPSEQQLLDAWEAIVAEHSELVKTDKSNNLFDLYHKISNTEWQLALVDKCLNALKQQYDADIAAILNDRGFGIVEPSDDREVYLRSLYAIETDAKTLIILLNQYKSQYKSMHPESTDELTEVNRVRYEKELAILSKFQGYRIKKEEITVLEYCAIINTYLEYIKLQKKEGKHG